jgi:YVTN family beta-propeller protein
MKKIIIALMITSLIITEINASIVPFAYVACTGSNTVVVINLNTNTVVKTIPTPFAPYGIAITPNNTFAYITYPNDGAVGVIDLTTNTIVGSPIGVGDTPVNLAVTPNSGYVIVANRNDSTFSIISTATQMNIPGSPFATLLDTPNFVAIAPNGETAYITNADSDSVLPIDIINPLMPIIYSVITIPVVGARMAGIAITSNSDTAYVVDYLSNPSTVVPINNLLTSPTFGSTINLSAGANSPNSALALSPDDLTAYVTINAPSSTTTDSVLISGPTVTPITVGTYPAYVAVLPDGQFVYVTNRSSDTVSVINPYNTVTTTINLSPYAMPQGIAIAQLNITPPNPPASAQGCAMPLLNDLTNIITWTPPASGPAPTAYNIYRDALLTDLIATISATDPLVYEDHHLYPNITYTYYIVSVDGLGVMSTATSVTVTQLCYPAIQPPSSIHGCAMQVGNTVTNIITWTAPASGPTPAEYQIFRDPYLYDLVATVPATPPLQYEDPNLSPSQTYTYYIISVDQYGDVSEPISITVTASCSTPGPSAPTNVIGVIRNNVFLDKTERILTITWTASSSTDVISYNIYNGTTLIANILATAPLTFCTLLVNGDNGQNFSITAVDSNGNESVHVPVTVM